jgi:tungstate transport system substrate-binding protein
MRRPVLAALAAAFLVLAAAGCGARDVPRLRLATTTSARDSGLLDWVLPEIERKEGVRVAVIAVGTGQALEIARRGDADLVLVHDRPKEDAFVKEGWGIERRDLMWNDFVLVGPAADPAHVRGSKDALEAYRAIARAPAAYVSRGDESGTHSREKRLLAEASTKSGWTGYAETGRGMGETLLVANERHAYALTDRATYASMRKRLDLEVLVEGDPRLRNPYGVMLVNPAKNAGVDAVHARAVLEWLVSPEGQARIAAFRVDGDAIFHPGAPPK